MNDTDNAAIKADLALARLWGMTKRVHVSNGPENVTVSVYTKG